MKDERLQTLISDRRALHKIPEIDFALPETLAYIEKRLSKLDCKLFHPIDSALCAFFDAGAEDCFAFRADMDALPIEEKNAEAYISAHPGKMHACGHDGHMSMLLSLADIVNERIAELPHNVLLIFQPAEETTGGARLICESGVLEKYRASAVFGIHLWPGMPSGKVFSKAGSVMARTSEVHVSVTGKSAHVAHAADGRDALFAAVQFLHEAYRTAEAMEPTKETRLLKFGCMQSGTVQNAISASSKIAGTLRAYSDTLYESLRAALDAIAKKTQTQTGCRIELEINQGYPAVINDAALYRRVAKHLGEQAPLALKAPSLTGEDFSFYQQRTPGVFFFLGTGREMPLHSDAFGFDEETLLSGLRLYEQILFLP